MAELSPKATLDDIVFAERNKAYGAYTLRKEYKSIVTRATLIGSLIFLLGIFAPIIISKIDTQEEVKATEVNLDLLNIPPPDLADNVPPPPPPPEVEVPKMETVAFLPPEVKKDEQVLEETPPPVVEKLETAVISNVTQEGDANAQELIIAPEAVAAPSKGTVVEAAPVKEEVFTIVEQQPEFVGGIQEMYKWLNKNIKYPPAAARANIQGKVFLNFIVGSDGSISNVEVAKGIGFGCDEEAKRAVNAMPKWKPGKQSGRAVKVKYSIPVNFQLSEQ